MNRWMKRFLVVATLLIAVGILWTPHVQAHWFGHGYHHAYYGGAYRPYHWYGGYRYAGYPYRAWHYRPTVTLPPTYVYPPYGTYYWGYYPYSPTLPPGGYYYVYPYGGF